MYHFILIILSTIHLFVPTESLTFKLYDGCGTSSYVCVGSRDNVPSVNTGGCITDRDCQVMVKVGNAISHKSRNAMYQWELAVETGKLPKALNHRNTVYLSVTREKLTISGPSGHYQEMVVNVPYYSYSKDKKPSWSHFEPRYEACQVVNVTVDGKESSTRVDCTRSRTVSLTSMQSKNFIYFNPMSNKNYVDSRLNYMGASGSSDQQLKVKINNYRELLRVNYTADLYNDQLTMSIFHWSASYGGKWSMANNVSNIEPFYFFKSHEKKFNWLWVYIILGVLAVALILVLCICCCIKNAICCH